MMKYARFSSAPLLVLALGCNTAQVTTPAPLDAGPACTDPSRTIFTCDAGEPVTPGACAGGVTVALDLPGASAEIPPGSYAPSCEVTFYHEDTAGGSDCLLYAPCICGDAGPNEAGVPSSAWSCGTSP